MVAAVRLAKYLAHAGVASRRAAEEIVRAGRVSVEGERVHDPARDVADEADVAVDGRPVVLEPPVVYLVNKPAGVLSTAADDRGRPTITALVAAPVRLYPVGRLDLDVTGLLLLTNDGELAHGLMHPRFEVPRTYRATVARPPVTEATLRALRLGVELEDGRTGPAEVRRLGADEIELTIHEGRKRQVKRMCAVVGHPVRRLIRLRFGPLELGDLAPGAHRRLSPGELAALRGAAGSTPAPTNPLPPG